MIVIFAGSDKSGKTTLISQVHKATNFEHQIVDRFTDSTFVYNKLFNRKIDDSEIFDFERQLNEKFNVKLVYVYASEDVIRERCLEFKEDDWIVESISKVLEYYTEYLTKTQFDYVKIDTSESSVEDCVERILEFINQKDRRHMVNKVSHLVDYVVSKGSDVAHTKEVNNILLNFELDNSAESLHDLEDQIAIYYEENSLNYTEISRFEKYFYDAIHYLLKHKIKSVTEELGETVTSRKFAYSSDECITSYHLLFRGDTCFINVALRSSEVKNVLLLDIYNSFDIAYKICNSFDMFNNVAKFGLNLFISSAHVKNKKGVDKSEK